MDGKIRQWGSGVIAIPSGNRYATVSITLPVPFKDTNMLAFVSGQTGTTTMGNVPNMVVSSYTKSTINITAWRNIDSSVGGATPEYVWSVEGWL